MKRFKELTIKQKECLQAHNMNPKYWLFVSETEFYYKFSHRITNKTIWICKYKSLLQKKGMK